MKCVREHARDACTSKVIKCHYCRGEHYIGSANYKKHVEEKEILAIQTPKTVSGTEARTNIYKDNPYRLSFSNGMKAPSESKKRVQQNQKSEKTQKE